MKSVGNVDDLDKSCHMNGQGDYSSDLECPARSKVTFLGDAAHPMSPFKGQGANQAIIDALVLARCLYSSNLLHPQRQSLDNALRQYEEEMMERSSSKVLKSRLAAKYLHSEDALTEANVTRASAAAMNEAIAGNFEVS